MIKSVITLFFTSALWASTCLNFVKVNNDSLDFIDKKGAVFKKAQLSSPIQKAVCIGNNRLVAITEEALYLTDTQGHLLAKYTLLTNFKYLKRINNNFIFKNRNYVSLLDITDQNRIIQSQYLLPKGELPLYFSFDQQGNGILFSDQAYYRNDQKIGSIVPLSVERKAFFYLDLKEKIIFAAHDKDYKQPVQGIKIKNFRHLQKIASAFDRLSMTELEKIFSQFLPNHIPAQLLASYLKKRSDRQAIRYLQTVASPQTVYRAMRLAGTVKVVNLGSYDNDITKLKTDIRNFLSKQLIPDYIKKYGTIKTKIVYPTQPEQPISFQTMLDDQPFFLFHLRPNCKALSSHLISEKAFKTFLSIPTVEIDKQYKLTRYRCTLTQNPWNQVKKFLENKFTHTIIAEPKLEFITETKRFTKELSRRSTEFGKIMKEAFSASPNSCMKLLSTCNKGCEEKENELRFNILSPSDRHACEDDCSSMLYYCKKGNMEETKTMFCSAQCKGASDESGIFSDSAHEKCMKKCKNQFNLSIR
ncbi:hypothetical protein MNB_SV-4-1227 [hydrothermal vent metagenome]|uniref:Uncharacterized protein n=1 Tax=hydrothermal vent metagenome TaxID=652676 RepID=A0A1W1E829_9ZZZZ